MTKARDEIMARAKAAKTPPKPVAPPPAPKAAEATPAPEKAKKKKRFKVKEKPRLPVGSRYTKEYVADGVWRVTLAVPTGNDDCPIAAFSAEGSASMKTEFACDDAYRQWLKTKEASSGDQ